MQVSSSHQGTLGIAKEEELRAGCVLCGPRMAGVGEGREWIPESPKAGWEGNWHCQQEDVLRGRDCWWPLPCFSTICYVHWIL